MCAPLRAKSTPIHSIYQLPPIGAIGAAVSALTAGNIPNPGMGNSISSIKADLAIDQSAISCDDFKIWMEKQRAFLKELVCSGERSQESADAEIERYEGILNEIENGAQVSVIAECSPDGTLEERITVIPPSDFKITLTDEGIVISE